MDIQMNEKNKNLVVEMTGEIDHHYTSEYKDLIDKTFGRLNCKNIIFDFNGVSFMDSSGIGMIIGRYRNLSATGGKVAAAGINNDLKRIFEISGLKKIIPCFDDVNEALNCI